jgi:hypothetical protein
MNRLAKMPQMRECSSSSAHTISRFCTYHHELEPNQKEKNPSILEIGTHSRHVSWGPLGSPRNVYAVLGGSVIRLHQRGQVWVYCNERVPPLDWSLTSHSVLDSLHGVTQAILAPEGAVGVYGGITTFQSHRPQRSFVIPLGCRNGR